MNNNKDTYREALDEAYPHPEGLSARVMERVREERARLNRRRRINRVVKFGSLAACFVLVAVLGIQLLPQMKTMDADSFYGLNKAEDAAPEAVDTVNVADGDGAMSADQSYGQPGKSDSDGIVWDETDRADDRIDSVTKSTEQEAPADQSTSTAGQSTAPRDPSAVESEGYESGDIPEDASRALVFRSSEEYFSFADSVNMTDGDFEEFISKNHYGVNGIRTKEDVEYWTEVLESLPIPYAPDFEMTNMYIMTEEAFEESYLYVLLYRKSDTLISFRIYRDKDREYTFDKSNPVSTEKMNGIDALWLVGCSGVGPETFYSATIDGYHVRISINGALPEASEEIVSSFTFEGMDAYR